MLNTIMTVEMIKIEMCGCMQLPVTTKQWLAATVNTRYLNTV